MVTDKDREYALSAAKECNGLNDVVDAIATARAEEREACAKACVAKHITRDEWDGGRWDEGYTSGVKACEAAIRARGED